MALDGLTEIPRPDLAAKYNARPPAACWVYEIRDKRRRLLYVGIADNFERRWTQHRAKSWWMNEVQVTSVYLNGYRSRWEARQVEASTIATESPVYNTQLESRALRGYEALFVDPRRPVDALDCVPVKKRYYKGGE